MATSSTCSKRRPVGAFPSHGPVWVPRAAEASDHLVVLGDQVDQLHLPVGEGGVEGGEAVAGGRCQLGAEQLVGHLQPALVDDLFEQPTQQRLALLGRRR
jgi:hypothetical protein